MSKNPSPATMMRMSAVKSRKVKWLVPGMVPCGKLTIVDGDPSQGKSFFTLELAAAVSNGQTLSANGRIMADRPGMALLFSAEDENEDTIVPRLSGLGANLDRIVAANDLVFRAGEDTPWAFPTHNQWLRWLCESVHPALIVIDPVMAFLAADVSPNSDQEVRAALGGLKKIAADTGAAIMLVRHLNKSGGQKVLYRGGGSIGLVGLVRSALYVGPNPENRHHKLLAQIKCNLGPNQLPWEFTFQDDKDGVRTIQWLGETAVPLSRLIGEEKEELPRERAAKFLADFLGDGLKHPVSLIEAAAKDAGITVSALHDAKRQLKAQHKSIAGVWYWLAPTARLDAIEEITSQAEE